MKKKPLAPRWMGWEHRFELERQTYAPGEPRITVANEWNSWKGWGVDPKPGSVEPWKKMLRYMFPNESERTWFERWCAWPLQHPGTKMYSAVLIWGSRHGTGKSLLGYSMMRVYGVNASEIKEADLRGAFNEWAENKQFVMGSEITGSDKRNEADALKSTVTQHTVRINPKYIPSYEVPDRINYYFTSNHPDAFFLEDTDRRYFIVEAPQNPLPIEFYRREYDPWLWGAEGPSALFYHLLHLPMGDFDPKAHAPDTTAKRAMITDSKSELGLFVARLKEDLEGALCMWGGKEKTACLATTPQLLEAYDPEHATKTTLTSLGRELKRAGFRQANGGIPVRTDAGLARLFILRDDRKWERAKPTELARHWNDTFWKAARTRKHLKE